MRIEYEKTGFREETKPGQRGQTCPYCGGRHMVLAPDSSGVVMRCGGKPVAKVMKSDQPQARDIVQRQAEKLVQTVLRQARHEDYPHPMGQAPATDHAREEEREVQIGREIIALVDVIRDVSSSESRQHAYDKITTLAQELVNMHSAGRAAHGEMVDRAEV